jgi:glycosyltransferase involved in cell wall biosynthesis
LIFCKKINLLSVYDFARVKIRDVFVLWFGGCIDRIYNSSVLPGMKNIFNTTSSGEVNVLTVGHVEDYKNPFLWVDVAKIVMQNSPADCVIRFLWVGEGSLLEECRIKVDALGLTSRIKFAGPSSSVAEFYEAADIYFQPSRMESFGIAVLDAMQYGLPTVVSSVGGLPELVSSGMNGYLLAEDDICGYADAILSLAVDRDKRNNFGASAKYKYLTKFNYERWQRETWVVHEKILKKQRKAHESTEKN